MTSSVLTYKDETWVLISTLTPRDERCLEIEEGCARTRDYTLAEKAKDSKSALLIDRVDKRLNAPFRIAQTTIDFICQFWINAGKGGIPKMMSSYLK